MELILVLNEYHVKLVKRIGHGFLEKINVLIKTEDVIETLMGRI